MIQIQISRFETAQKYRDGEQLKWGVIWRNIHAEDSNNWEAWIKREEFNEAPEETMETSLPNSLGYCIEWLEERLGHLEVVKL